MHLLSAKGVQHVFLNRGFHGMKLGHLCLTLEYMEFSDQSLAG